MAGLRRQLRRIDSYRRKEAQRGRGRVSMSRERASYHDRTQRTGPKPLTEGLLTSAIHGITAASLRCRRFREDSTDSYPRRLPLLSDSVAVTEVLARRPSCFLRPH